MFHLYPAFRKQKKHAHTILCTSCFLFYAKKAALFACREKHCSVFHLHKPLTMFTFPTVFRTIPDMSIRPSVKSDTIMIISYLIIQRKEKVSKSQSIVLCKTTKNMLFPDVYADDGTHRQNCPLHGK